MIKIELLGHPLRAVLIIDGVEYKKHVDIFRINEADSYKKGDLLRASIFDETARGRLFAHRFNDLPRELVKIELNHQYLLPLGELLFSMKEIEREGTEEFSLIFILDFYPQNWKQLWSFSEYQSEFFTVATQQDLAGVRYEMRDSSIDELSFDTLFDKIVFTDIDANSTINKEALKKVKVLQQIHELTIASLTKKLHESSVVMHFDFPEEVRVPCEQYLLYFVQFLKDLGVQATAELLHQAGQVLFAVTPSDKDEALDKIREALGTYLQLPSKPTADSLNVEQEVAVQRLSANIDHLKSQLRLAHAELRLAGATIQTQQVTIKHLLSGEVIIESLKDVTPKPDRDNKQELLGGTVTLTKYNWKGVEFDLAEIFRKLRQLFKEDR